MQLKKKEFTAELMTVTPELAHQLLGSGDNFRTLSKRRVESLVADIVAGKWHMNGESIKITLDGKLTDGQHRCAAVVATGISILTVAVWSDDTLGVDRGQPRNFGQLLAHNGVTNTSIRQAMTRVLLEWQTTGQLSLTNIRPRTDDEMWRCHAHLDADTINACIPKANAIAAQKLLSPSQAAILLYILTRIDANLADDFYQGLVSGANLPANSPVLVLRNRLSVVTKDAKSTGGGYHARFVLALSIKAWNAYCTGRSVSVLKFLDTEDFPVPYGWTDMTIMDTPLVEAKGAKA